MISDPEHLFVGFNSIGGFSTINHLHFQLFSTKFTSSRTDLIEERFFKAYSESREFEVLSREPLFGEGSFLARHKWVEGESLYRAFAITH
jgi:hypothetical protein